jgi:probable HAF family extracellular repeat protein
VLTLFLASTAHAGLLDLGTLGGTTSQAFGIRPDGTVVVGSSLNAVAQNQAFAWAANAGFTGGTMTALSFLSGGTAAEARAINAAGLIVGYSRDNAATDQAVTWSGTTPTLLGNTLGGAGARAFGVSTAGVIVGWARQTGGTQRAFVAIGGSMSALNLSLVNPQHDPSLGHNARALGISPNGRYVVGEYDVDNGGGTEVRGFVFDRTTPASSYEFSGGGVGSARGTSDTHGVGTITNPPDALAGFSRHASGSSDFLPAFAGGTGASNAINASGFSVGTENIIGLGQRAIAWDAPSAGANAINLDNTHGTANTLVEGTAIADVGNTYAGWGLFGGQTHAFLLVIPEPGSAGLMVLPALTLLGLIKRRRRC